MKLNQQVDKAYALKDDHRIVSTTDELRSFIIKSSGVNRNWREEVTLSRPLWLRR